MPYCMVMSYISALYRLENETYDSISFGRTTEFIKDLLPSMQIINTILGLDKSAVNVNTQMNNENKQDNVTLNIIGV